MKLERVLSFLSFLGFSIVMLLFLAWNQKPLCIDSRVVERIDRISPEGQETVYRCSQKRRVPFTAFWGQNLASINDRLNQSERFLEGVEPFKKKYQINLLTDQGMLFRVRGQQIFIGEDLFKTEGQIERLLTSLWVYDKTQGNMEQPDLYREVMSDFILHLALGSSVNLKNPVVAQAQGFDFADWPIVLRSQKGYCESFWSSPQHYQFCSNVLSQDMGAIEKPQQWVELSLRPYILKSLLASYEKLNLAEKNQIYSSYAKILRSFGMSTKGELLDISSTDLEIAQNKVQKFGELLFRAGQEQGLAAVIKLTTSYNNSIYSDVIEKSTSLARVDFIFEFSQAPVKDLQKDLQVLADWSQKNTLRKIAVLAQDELYLLPMLSPLEVKSFGQLASRQRIILGCDDVELGQILKYEEMAEKILLVNDCQQNMDLDYLSFIRGGIEAFAAKNSEVSFVYFHMPSLVSKKTEIKNLGRIFANIKHAQTPLAKVLGWQEVEYNSASTSFLPKAFIEGVQAFRFKKQ